MAQNFFNVAPGTGQRHNFLLNCHPLAHNMDVIQMKMILKPAALLISLCFVCSALAGISDLPSGKYVLDPDHGYISFTYSHLGFSHPHVGFRKFEVDLSLDADDPNKSKLVVTEAMHGAIVADAFRVKWIPVSWHNFIVDYKWRDWCGSLNMQYQPLTLKRLLTLERSFRNKVTRRIAPLFALMKLRFNFQHLRPFLSEDSEIERVTAGLSDCLDELRADHF